jgi:hypothetical protein
VPPGNLIASEQAGFGGDTFALRIGASLLGTPIGAATNPLKKVEFMPARASQSRNDYRCSIEKNQNGKYCIRMRVQYPRHAWSLGVFFLASSFDRAMKKLEESLHFLQRNEEKLWFWGVDRAEDMGFSAEFLKDAGLQLDRRNEFPRKAAILSLEPERDAPASALGFVRRGLAESVESGRVQLAGD